MKHALLSTCLVLFAVAGFAQKTGQSHKVLADKIVGVLGDKIVLRSDILNYIDDEKRQGRTLPPDAGCMLLQQMLVRKAMMLQAQKDSLPISDEEVEAELDQRIRYFINMYGGKEALEQIAGKTLYQLKEDNRAVIREQKLTEAMQRSIIENVKITPTEVKNYFESIPPESLPYYETELEIRQVVAYGKASRDMEKYAQDELAEYKRQIESGLTSFERLAKMYSDDPGTKEIGGRFEFNRSDKNVDGVFAQTAFALKEGQISRVVKSRFGYHIIQLVSRSGDDVVVRHILKIPQVMDAEINEAIEKLDTIRSKLVAKTLTFGQAVEQYSEDDNSKFNAGSVTNEYGSPYLAIDQLDKSIVVILDQLKVGEYSKPMPFTDERGKKGARILFLQSKSEPHRENLKDDYNKIAQRVLEDKKGETLNRWLQTKMPTFYMTVDDEYKQCPDIATWLSLSPSNTTVSN
ncbi:MAG: peptidylprolyl isomerase [Chitinophagaceae bacterium]|nr:peptidylprolyl isomerase [Chitinophagaceae bacterium]MCW5925637.1 peptidylprolyl isomerase [Chitinophagaceae bacterium]